MGKLVSLSCGAEIISYMDKSDDKSESSILMIVKGYINIFTNFLSTWVGLGWGGLRAPGRNDPL